jgi:hypothetical protein
MNYKYRFRRLNVEEGEALLNTFVRTADVAFLQKMLAWGLNINDPDSSGRTPLMHAVRSGRGLDVIKWLLDNGARIDAEDVSGKNVLHFLSEKTGWKEVQFLLEKSPNLAKKRWHNGTALHHAVSLKDSCVVEVIAQASRDCINEIDGRGRTPLAFAVINGNTSFVEILCRYGANPNVTDITFPFYSGVYSPLELAVQNKNQEMVEVLIKCGARYDEDRARINAEKIADYVKNLLLANPMSAVIMSRFADGTSPEEMFAKVKNLPPQTKSQNVVTSQQTQQLSFQRPGLPALYPNSSLSAHPSPSVQSALATPDSLAMAAPVTLSSLAAAAAATVSSLPPLHPFAKGSPLPPAAGGNAQSSEAQKNNSMQIDE